jgi:hypothetical protein
MAGSSPDEPEGTAAHTPASLDRSVQDELGVMLQGLYATLMQEPLPERLLALIQQVETTGGGPERAGEGEP